MRRALGFGAALVASVGVHAAGLSLGPASETVRTVGGATVAEVRIGSAFQAMVQGRPVAAVQPATQVEAVVTPPTEPAGHPERTPSPPPTEPARPVPPVETAASPEQVPQSLPPTTQMAAAEPAPASSVGMATPALTATILQPAAPSTPADAVVRAPDAAALRTAPSAVAKVRAVPAPSPTPAAAKAADAGPRVAGVDPQDAPPLISARPRARPPVPDDVRLSPPLLPATRPASGGNADRTRQAGSATGREQATSTAPAATAHAQAAGSGTSDAANYPGQIMARLARQPVPRLAERGRASVAFTVSAGGGIGTLSIIGSSGSATVDRAALAFVRGAAPFPRPPVGAQTRFSVPFGVGR